MRERTFVDTNVLLYAHDTSAGDRFLRARLRLIDLWQDGTGVLSTQVLQEFTVNATRKLAKPLAPIDARRVVATYAAWPVHLPGPEHVLAASEVAERHHLSFWDALILTSAAAMGATRLLTEDLQDGQIIDGVEIVDPFAGDGT